MQLSQDQKGEFYTSGVIKAMLDDKIPCKMLQLERTDLHVLGTPAQVRSIGLTPCCFSLPKLLAAAHPSAFAQHPQASAALLTDSLGPNTQAPVRPILSLTPPAACPCAGAAVLPGVAIAAIAPLRL